MLTAALPAGQRSTFLFIPSHHDIPYTASLTLSRTYLVLSPSTCVCVFVCVGRRKSPWKSSPTTASWAGWLVRRAATWRRSRRRQGPRLPSPRKSPLSPSSFFKTNGDLIDLMKRRNSGQFLFVQGQFWLTHADARRWFVGATPVSARAH